MAALVAFVLMIAKNGSSTDLDGLHDPQMIAGQLVGFSIDRPVPAKDLRHFQAGRCAHSRLQMLFIERTGDSGQIQSADMEIDGCCRGRPVPQKQLDMVETCSGLNQMGGKTVPQGVYTGRFDDAGQLFCFLKELLYRTHGYMAFLFCTFKQPFGGVIFSPILPQKLKGRCGQDGVAVFAPLALTDPDHHPLTVNIGNLEACSFTYSNR